MPRHTADVVVVGAGPAGCAAAVTLARAGRQVLVLDKATFPREKCCGDGLTTAALRRLEALGAEPAGLESWKDVRDISIRSPSGRIARVQLPFGDGTYGAVCERAVLDTELAAAARRAGAKLEEGRRFTELARDPAHGRLALQIDGDETVETSYVIGADGIWSAVRRAAGAADRASGGGPYLGEWHAYRRYFSGASEEAAEHLWIWFDEPVLPGYAWSFPMSGARVNVGATLLRRPGRTGADFHALFEAVLDSAWVRSLLGRHAHPEAEARSWPIPTRVRGSTPTALAGRVLFAGDAARLADPLTGEGVAQALESGAAAAEAIIEGAAEGPARVASLYERALARSLRLDNELAKWLCTLLNRPLGARAAVRGAGLPGVRSRFGAWLFEDFPRAIALTPWRWERGALSRPGAFAAPASPSPWTRA